MPAKAGIQYAEAAVMITDRQRGVLDHPLSRMMTSLVVATKAQPHATF
jgi:hypothetical protein